MSEPKSASLFFTEGSSNKEYHAALISAGEGGWLVNFRYGPRGRATNAGTKTPAPLPYDKALKVYDKLVKSKTDKGYTPDVSGAAYTATGLAGRATTYRPQLLNSLTRQQGLEADDFWLAQEKHDGERRGVICTRDGDMIFANRRGLRVEVQARIAEAVTAIHREFPEGFSLDCEDMGDHLVVFDLPDWPGQADDAPFAHRARNMLNHLQRAVDRNGVGEVIRIDHPDRFVLFKAGRLAEIEARGGEGYVLKDPEAPYTHDRPNSGGPAMKVKFVETATCRVSGANADRRSVGIELIGESGDWEGVGNVTIPAGRALPAAGDLIEVEYLYAHRGGSLFQPVFRGARSDLDEAACVTAQLKYKGETAPEPETDAGPGF